MNPIISSLDLLKIIDDKNVLIFDVSNDKNAFEKYIDCHIKNARFVNVNIHLATKSLDTSNGGRHPLPSIIDFKSSIEELGIENESHVVLYDRYFGSNASARFWWMIKAIGHEKVQVLNGGFQEAIKINFPLEQGENLPKKSVYKIVKDSWNNLTKAIDEVELFAKSSEHLVIDVRDKDRFDGKIEPLDLIAGHIPGAINVPFKENLDENGLFLEKELLRKKYLKVIKAFKSENIIVHCGSGVTACHTLLAMNYADLEMPNLYVGSWSEWSRSGKEVKTVEE